MEHVEQATAPLVSKSNHDASLKTLDHKLRPVEQKQLQHSDILSKCFNSLAEDMGAKFDKLCQSVERSVSSLSHTVTQTLQVPATKQEGYERKFESNYNQRTIYPCTDQHDRANADVDAFIKTTSALALQRQCDLSEKVSSPTMISQHADPPGMTLLLA